MSYVSVIINDEIWWFGVRTLLYRLMDDYYEVYKDSLTDKKWKLIDEGESSKFFYVKDLNKSDFQEVSGIVDKILIENISLNHEEADKTLAEYKTELIELQTVFSLDPRAKQSPERERYIVINDAQKWTAPHWVWYLVTARILVHLQEKDFIDAAHKVEQAWKNDVEGYDFKLLDSDARKAVTSLVDSMYEQYISNVAKGEYGTMQLKGHGNILVESVSTLKKLLNGKDKTS